MCVVACFCSRKVFTDQSDVSELSCMHQICGRWRASPVKLAAIYIRLRARIIGLFWSPTDVTRQTTLASFLGGYNEAATVRDRFLAQKFDDENRYGPRPISPASKRLRTVQAEATAHEAREARAGPAPLLQLYPVCDSSFQAFTSGNVRSSFSRYLPPTPLAPAKPEPSPEIAMIAAASHTTPRPYTMSPTSLRRRAMSVTLDRSAAMASRPITISVGWARGRPC